MKLKHTIYKFSRLTKFFLITQKQSRTAKLFINFKNQAVRLKRKLISDLERGKATVELEKTLKINGTSVYVGGGYHWGYSGKCEFHVFS